MSYPGRRRGSRKAAATVRIRHLSGGNSELSLNGGAFGAPAPLSTSAYFQLFASLPKAVNMIEIFSDTGETLELATGAPSSEVPLLQIPPGGEIPNYVRMEQGDRISIKAITTTPLAGTYTIINFFD